MKTCKSEFKKRKKTIFYGYFRIHDDIGDNSIKVELCYKQYPQKKHAALYPYIAHSSI